MKKLFLIALSIFIASYTNLEATIGKNVQRYTYNNQIEYVQSLKDGWKIRVIKFTFGEKRGKYEGEMFMLNRHRFTRVQEVEITKISIQYSAEEAEQIFHNLEYIYNQ